MEALLLLIASVLGLATLDALAIRFGVDSREGSRDRRQPAHPSQLK